MCINPSYIWVQRGPKYEQQPVACRQCWRCKKNRVNDYVARAMCEASVSSAVCTLTLTYAPRDDLAEKVIHPRHFQLFIKRLRRAGHKVRYLVAGEYGKLKDRAHFHALLFFTHITEFDGPAPSYNSGHIINPESSRPFSRQIPQWQMFHICEWPHGHIKADWSASEQSARYVCKYLLADDKNNAWFSLSKKPALGAAWFAQKAKTARELGVLPSSFEYLPPGGSKDRPYLMTGATRRDYLNAIIGTELKDNSYSAFPYGNGDCRETMSEWVAKAFDKHERERFKDYLESLPFDPEAEAEAYRERMEEATEQRKREFRAYLRRMSDELDEAMRNAVDTFPAARIINGRITFEGKDYGPAFKQRSQFDRD